jgi:hypothetical protein
MANSAPAYNHSSASGGIPVAGLVDTCSTGFNYEQKHFAKNNSEILLTTVSKIWIFLLEGIFVF